MRCDPLSKKHFEVAEQANIGLIVQVKSNQPTLLETVGKIAAKEPPASVHTSHDKARGRDERRTVMVFTPAKHLDGSDWQAHVKTIVRVERLVYTRNVRSGLLNRTHEIAFYISNRTLRAEPAATAIRGHWSIETTSHYSRDVTFNEDRSRIRKNPGVFARLRSFGFNILKANRKGSLSQDRYRAALGGIEGLSKLVNI
jgi:hypothetical protein